METFTKEELTLPPCKYEYLDHTADVQLHAWGDSLKEAYEQCGLAMFGYMTEINTVEIKQCSEIEATGDDLDGLLFHFLDELLFLFSCEPFLICSKLVITEFRTEGDELKIKCKCYGEEFTLGKHPQGTEVKAITYSAMQIINDPENKKFEVFVIIDI
ncbi:protein archease-like [Tribolium castaneum]|uniref:Protein archease-like n=1 Tax=Tribolium castaneum TaxID=7070 RepID=D6WKY5_TRICA|nr:PREDICTED: protein archease-like [Tribolium castaneum]EFA04039.1 Protein archease-like [Tribolium castaneum]|eukprot:XP_008193639.1 PREDICTED: protein archease-like [Tribolium castaneum]